MLARGILVISLFVIAALLVFGACSSAAPATFSPTPTPNPFPSPSSTGNTSEPSSLLPSFADVVSKVEPAVVFISVEYVDSSSFFQAASVKSGSGVLLSPDGYILTNNHVVSDSRKTEVSLPGDENTYEAQILGADSLSDLAVLKIEAGNFPYLSFGDASKLRIGDWVIAVGNALGLAEGGPTVTQGIVSNLDRSFPPASQGDSAFYDVIQTDAAINPGNSGGPLVNLQGEVIGINTFIISGAQNIGFAISASTAQRVYADLVEHGRVIRPYLGASLQEVTPALATELGLSKDRGVLVAYLAPDGPAARAGMQENDIITEFQGQKVSQPSKLIKLLWQYQVGDKVTVTFWRGNDQQSAEVTLGERP